MRILCLHGRGTNSDIFESQLAPIISRLPGSYEFDFVDAPSEVNAAPGVASHHPGPYLAWHRRCFTDDVLAAHEYIKTIIEEDGPYDGVVGFSQGAALAASLLLSHQIQSPEEPTPFKFAILICSVLPLTPSEDLGIPYTKQVLEYEAEFKEFLGLGEDDFGADAPSATAHIYEPFLEADAPQSPQQSKIDLPTLHMLGSEDRFFPFGKYAVSLCEERKTEVIINQCGHELPRSEDCLDKAAALIEQIIELSKIDF